MYREAGTSAAQRHGAGPACRASLSGVILAVVYVCLAIFGVLVEAEAPAAGNADKGPSAAPAAAAPAGKKKKQGASALVPHTQKNLNSHAVQLCPV